MPCHAVPPHLLPSCPITYFLLFTTCSLLMTMAGESMATAFSLTATDFTDDAADLPLRYVFWYLSPSRAEGSAGDAVGQRVPLSASRESEVLSGVVLPASERLVIGCTVTDAHGASVDCEPVEVSVAAYSGDLNPLLQSLNTSVDSLRDVEQTMQGLAVAVQLLQQERAVQGGGERGTADAQNDAGGSAVQSTMASGSTSDSTEMEGEEERRQQVTYCLLLTPYSVLRAAYCSPTCHLLPTAYCLPRTTYHVHVPLTT